jgi:hypothetical protein
MRVISRDTREGWPLLTVEIEMNGASKRFLFCLGFSSQPSTKDFFLTVHYFNSFVTIAQQAGQAAVLGRLSLSVCLWLF